MSGSVYGVIPVVAIGGKVQYLQARQNCAYIERNSSVSDIGNTG